eukprot:TRINITY_DN5649_c0_g5_i1.p1 TRINITY_DN5649_c0_g5~~TRINITY_DN5649_c0_g5_i1.p1  ORF type:complete len:1032 (+),score=208.77 TRINITY_DN5649_c0_g5_i1:94-3189(+)
MEFSRPQFWDHGATVLEASQRKWMVQHDMQNTHYPSSKERLVELAQLARCEAGPNTSVVEGIKELGLPMPKSLRQAVRRLEPSGARHLELSTAGALSAPTKSSPSDTRRQSSRTASKEQMMNSKMVWERMNECRTRKTQRRFGNTLGFPRRASIIGLPKIQEGVKSASFEDLFGTALRRAARKRAETRDVAASTSLPTLNPHTVKCLKLEREWVRRRGHAYPENDDDADVLQRAQPRQSVMITASQAEQERMAQLTLAAVSALATEDEICADSSQVQAANESAWTLGLKKIEDPPEVAEMLRPPDIVSVLERVLGEGGFSAQEEKRMEDEFKRCQVASEVHVDSLMNMALNLGYLMADEDNIHEIVKRITDYSTMDLNEYKLFMNEYNAFERKHIREVFESFDEDNSGELETSEVREVLTALGCSPFKGTLERLINAVDADKSGSLDLKEFIALIVAYRSTEGFSHRDIKDIWRVFSRFARTHAKRNVLQVPKKKLTDALIFMFGPQAAELARQLAGRVVSLRRKKSVFVRALEDEKRNDDESTEDDELAEGLPFRQFVAWVRRMKEAEIQEYIVQFKEFDASGDGVLDLAEIRGLLIAMGYTPLRSTIRGLIAAVDQNNDGTVDLEEFLDVMEYFKKWDGFVGSEIEHFKKNFNSFKNEEDEIAVVQIRDIFQSWGLDQDMRTIQQYIKQVDVDGSHTLNFKEFLRLMRMFREAELSSIKSVFDETVKNAVWGNTRECDNNIKHISPMNQLKEALHRLGYDANTSELVKLCVTHPEDNTDGNWMDFDRFVEIADECREEWRFRSRKRANFGDAEVHDFRSAFDSYDTDHSGEIDRDELTDLIKDLELPLVTRADQARLVSMIQAARKAAADAGVPEAKRGKVTDPALPVQFVVFLFLVRMVLKERENDQFNKEQEECLKLQFSKKEIAGLRGMFSHWSMFNDCDEDAKNEDGAVTSVSGTISVQGFVEFIKSLNKDLSKADEERLVSNVERIMKEQEAISTQVTFTIFMHMIRWMLTYNFANIQDYLDFD